MAHVFNQMLVVYIVRCQADRRSSLNSAAVSDFRGRN
jgi:hypothetical protein